MPTWTVSIFFLYFIAQTATDIWNVFVTDVYCICHLFKIIAPFQLCRFTVCSISQILFSIPIFLRKVSFPISSCFSFFFRRIQVNLFPKSFYLFIFFGKEVCFLSSSTGSWRSYWNDQRKKSVEERIAVTCNANGIVSIFHLVSHFVAGKSMRCLVFRFRLESKKLSLNLQLLLGLAAVYVYKFLRYKKLNWSSLYQI